MSPHRPHYPKHNTLMNFKRLILITTLATLTGAGTAYVHHIKDTPAKNEIRYTGEMYTPSTLTIPVGTTVVFTNTSDAHHWPASDLHPHHSLYSDFDPKQGLAPGESWEFTFDKAGSWGFHNHLQSFLGGRVIVHEENQAVVPQCEANPDTPACWTAELELALQKEGAEASLKKLSQLYDTHEKFRQDCHNFTHDIGLKTYISYGTDFSWPTEVAYCNAGFMHGYMEGYLNDKTDLLAVDKFCTSLTNKLSSDFPSIELQCRHGVGHGYGEHLLYTHTDLWNDPNTLYQMATEGCAIANHTETTRMVCAYGALTVIHTIDNSRTTADVPKLFSLCKKQIVPFAKEACYWGTPKFIPYIYNHEPNAAIQSLVTNFPKEDADFFARSLISLTNTLARQYLHQPDSEIINLCRSNFSDSQEQATCLTGMIQGLLYSGAPEQEYLRALTVCTSDFISASEATSCYNTITDVVYAHSSTSLPEACSLIPQDFLPTTSKCTSYIH